MAVGEYIYRKTGGLYVAGNKVSLDPLSGEQGNETVCFPLEVVHLISSYGCLQRSKGLDELKCI